MNLADVLRSLIMYSNQMSHSKKFMSKFVSAQQVLSTPPQQVPSTASAIACAINENTRHAGVDLAPCALGIFTAMQISRKTMERLAQGRYKAKIHLRQEIHLRVLKHKLIQ